MTHLKNNQEWREKGHHLPEYLRDFHNQKAIFRTIANFLEPDPEDPNPIDWRQAQIYTIDRFLWFMAQHGYTLQKTRVHIDVLDLDQTIEQFDPRNQALQQFKDMLQKGKTISKTGGIDERI